jgi:hypothetical protein
MGKGRDGETEKVKSLRYSLKRVERFKPVTARLLSPRLRVAAPRTNSRYHLFFCIKVRKLSKRYVES